MQWTLWVLFAGGLFALADVTQSSCVLSKYQVENETRLFTIYDSQRGTHTLLRGNEVPANTELHLFCTSTNKVSVTCKQNGNFSETIPMTGTKGCSKPMKAEAVSIAMSGCLAPRIGYSVQFKISNEQLELFRTCMDTARLSTSKFAVHTFHPVSPDVTSERAEVQWQLDRLMSANKAVNCFKNTIVGARLLQLVPTLQIGSLVVDRGHLAPSGDFIYPSHKSATNRYMNAVQQFYSINRGNWKKIESWLRRTVTAQQQASIITGALDDPLKMNNVSIVLQPDCTIPKWVYKVVKLGQGRYAFLNYNNMFDTVKPAPKCREIKCPSYLRFNVTYTSGYSFCCDYNDFMVNVTSYLQQVQF